MDQYIVIAKYEQIIQLMISISSPEMQYVWCTRLRWLLIGLWFVGWLIGGWSVGRLVWYRFFMFCGWLFGWLYLLNDWIVVGCFMLCGGLAVWSCLAWLAGWLVYWLVVDGLLSRCVACWISPRLMVYVCVSYMHTYIMYNTTCHHTKARGIVTSQ